MLLLSLLLLPLLPSLTIVPAVAATDSAVAAATAADYGARLPRCSRPRREQLPVQLDAGAVQGVVPIAVRARLEDAEVREGALPAVHSP